jgi:hypothetical protein
VCNLLGTRLATSTAFHPQTDGQTERANRTLEDYLRHYVGPLQDDWDELLTGAEFAYNHAWQESVRALPFELNFGQQARTPMGLGNAQVPAAGTFVGCMHEAHSSARELLYAAQQRMKAFADQKRRFEEYGVEDQVHLSTKHLRLQNPRARKLLPKWVGPFEVLKKVGQVAYKLRLPANIKVHPVFHVSLLRAYRRDGRVQPPPPPITVDGDLEYEIERILSHRDRKYGQRIKKEYLIQWLSYGPEHNSWEPEKTLLKNAKEVLQEYLDAVNSSSAEGVERRADRPRARKRKRPARYDD